MSFVHINDINFKELGKSGKTLYITGNGISYQQNVNNSDIDFRNENNFLCSNDKFSVNCKFSNNILDCNDLTTCNDCSHSSYCNFSNNLEHCFGCINCYDSFGLMNAKDISNYTKEQWELFYSTYNSLDNDSSDNIRNLAIKSLENKKEYMYMNKEFQIKTSKPIFMVTMTDIVEIMINEYNFPKECFPKQVISLIEE